MTRLDPRTPLVVDVRELGRRAGAMEQIVRPVPAPADLGIEVIGVPEGSPMDLDLRLESVVDGVLVSGSLQVPAEGECARCLEPLERRVRVDLQELYLYPGVETDEEDASFVQDGLVDLEPAIRDAIVLGLPLAPLCSAGCQGLCPECGARLADEPDHAHDVVDPRWAALAGLGDPRAVEDGSETS